jgi:hypothetical protein
MKATQTAPQTETNQTYKIPAKLLSKGSTNAKTTKNDRETHILYLAPVDQKQQEKRTFVPLHLKGAQRLAYIAQDVERSQTLKTQE